MNTQTILRLIFAARAVDTVSLANGAAHARAMNELAAARSVLELELIRDCPTVRIRDDAKDKVISTLREIAASSYPCSE